ncbi:MAG: hypothetical protein WC693_04285 [Patescibacteria group bacterium]|jgi:hypothetical protein
MSKEFPDINQGVGGEIADGVEDDFDFEGTPEDLIQIYDGQPDTEQAIKEFDTETSDAVQEIIADLSPEEVGRIHEMADGRMELSDATKGKLKLLSERAELLVKKYAEKHGAAAAGVMVGAGMTATGIPGGWMGVAESGSAGLILSALVFELVDSIQNDRVFRSPFNS